MQLYPENAAEKLGFQEILQATQNYCLTEEGREFAAKLKPLTSQVQIENRLAQTLEFHNLLLYDAALPIGYLPRVQTSLVKAEIPGNYLNEEEFFKLLQWLRTVQSVVGYFKERKEKYPELAKLLNLSAFDTGFTKEIEKVVGADGFLLPNASPELQRLRRALADRQSELRTLMERLLKNARSSGWTEGQASVIRNERLVIPINADFKGKMNGLVHDVSGSGQTLYIEPIEAVGLNNEARELRLRERNEIIRILTSLTDTLRPLLPEFYVFLKFMTFVDVIRAKAKLAIELNANLPKLDAKAKRLELFNARHPQLLLQKGKTKTVPLNLELDAEKRILLISGPNSGGKTVSLKTVGLLQIMLQSGFLVPADDHSTFPLIHRLLIDIGDDQSIQNDLSAYTAHLSHMSAFLKGLNAKSLFLIDEFGSGTDPVLGGPMAEALLEKFVEKNAFGLVATHYSNLKDFAAANPHTINGAMRFDLQTITPTYQLQQGLPGSSYAFEIAARAGIAPEIINRARNKVGQMRTDIETLLATLKIKEESIEALNRQILAKENELKELIAYNQTLKKDLENKKQKLTKELKEAAAYSIHEANKKIEATIREIREAEAEKERTKQLRKELEKELKNPTVEIPETPDPEVLPYEELPDEVIETGDWVKLPDSDTVVKVLEIKDKKAIVALGEMQTAVKLKELTKVARRESKKIDPASQWAWQQMDRAARQIDLRGLRLEDALPMLDKFMDNAILAGMPEVLILHGKGTGVLRNGVRHHLNKYYSQVKKMEDALEDQGGTGITVCSLG